MPALKIFKRKIFVLMPNLDDTALFVDKWKIEIK
jgi:hypothetical protein